MGNEQKKTQLLNDFRELYRQFREVLINHIYTKRLFAEEVLDDYKINDVKQLLPQWHVYKDEAEFVDKMLSTTSRLWALDYNGPDDFFQYNDHNNKYVNLLLDNCKPTNHSDRSTFEHYQPLIWSGIVTLNKIHTKMKTVGIEFLNACEEKEEQLMAIDYNLTRDNLITEIIKHKKNIVVNEHFLELNLQEEQNRIVLKDIFVNRKSSHIPEALFDDILDYTKKEFEHHIHEHLDELNDQFALIKFSLRDIEIYLFHYLRENHADKLLHVQMYTEEKLDDYIISKMAEYLSNIPKAIRPVKNQFDEYSFIFEGYAYWDSSEEDIFITDEIGEDEREVATIYLIFEFNHPLIDIHYYNAYRKKYDTEEK